MIKAEIIADSLSPQGHRLTTFICVFPRIVLAEFNTHRMLSRNSASSRAIPFEKMVKMVEENPFIPIKWMKDHKGMQGNEYFTEEEVESLGLLSTHLAARNWAVGWASEQNKKGLSKQICNRYLEPFMWHTVIVTGTEWENFFALRAHPDAEIHIADLAHKMLEAYNQSTPKKLNEGEWHIPFGDTFDEDRVYKETYYREGINKNSICQTKIMIATARCARVSYLNFEGKDDYEADIKLHDRLLESGHMSPFEHCAKVMSEREYEAASVICLDHEITELLPNYSIGWSGNFRGFIQYRKMITGENKIDNRVIKKV